MYNKIKRNIKTVVLRGIIKVKKYRSKRESLIPEAVPPRFVFVEIGTGHHAEWTYLIRDDWRDIACRKKWANRLRTLPESWLSETGNWHGYLVEAHPDNFSSLVKKTVSDERFRPFLHRLTFINAAISRESQFTTMGIETGVFKRLFINRYTLSEARPFHPNAVDNTMDFGVFTVSLETLFSAIGHEQIDLLRMDVEGAEVSILEAYSFRIKPLLFSIEYHSKVGETSIRRVLETKGYRIDAQNAEELRGIYEV